MTEIPIGLPHRWEGGTLQDVVERALSELIATAGEGSGEDETFTVVFTGEAGNAETAFRAAFEDIVIQCADHNGTPVDVSLDGLMATDDGVRIWGSVTCAPEHNRPWQEPKLTAITIHQEGDALWTLTIVRA